MISYDGFIAEWNGRQVTKFGGECVALIAEFEAENNLPIVWGDAHQWINNPIMLGAYNWVVNNPNDPNQLPNRGDIVVWPLPNEHIAFYDMNLGNHQFQSFGQNSGGKQAHFQPHTWARVAGWYTPKVVVALPAPAPAPPPPAPTPPPPPPVVHPYSIEAIAPKQLMINRPTHKWGLNYDNFTAINDNPEGDATPGQIFTATGLLHHNIGYTYYLPDAAVASGYNIVDCDEYSPPPPEPAPAPKPPDGPLTIPSTEPYEVLVDIPGYTNSSFAINHAGATVNVPAGTYYIFNTREPAINVTKTPGKPGSWINPSDNVAPPTKEEVAAEIAAAEAAQEAAEAAKPEYERTYTSFVSPDYYVAMQDLQVPDVSGDHKPAFMQKYGTTVIAGTFTHEGILYARPDSGAKKDWWYGIPMTDPETNLPNLELEREVYSTDTSTAEHKVLKALTVHDYLVLAVAKIKQFWDAIRRKR